MANDHGTIDKNRRIYIDFLKIVAIYMVLFNHTGTNGFVLFTVAHASKLYWFYLFNSIFIKIAVPLFFMASGALLLPKEESYGDLLRKRVMKFSLTLVITSVVMYCYSSFRLGEQHFSLFTFVKTLYSSEHSVALWYLYSYLAFLIMLPLLRKLVKAMNRSDYKWIIAVYGAVSSLKIIEYLIWRGTAEMNSNFSLFFMSINVFFPIMGYYIDQVLQEEDFSLKRFMILAVISFVAISICCAMTHFKCYITGDWREIPSQTFYNTLIFIPSITAFYGAKLLFMHCKVSDKVKRIIITASETTFGIFLFERVFRFETISIFYHLRPFIHTLPACWIWILVACVGGGIVVFVMKKIPYVNSYI